MEEQNNENGTVWSSIKDEFSKKKVSDIGVFTIKPNEFALIKWFKLSVNYTMYGFVMFMTAVILFITLVVI
jgi:hypothetical protein